ncbi:transaldolase [Candidatus Uhrbacteria bacterium]|nr:transaldolase [Candidatus Uhrbacteria bacterium]
MKPQNFQAKIFVDGGDPKETSALKNALGFLDGQTTNPTLITKNPEAKARLARGEKFSSEELLVFYKGVVQELSRIIPDGSVSIEVYADSTTTADAMFAQGKEMFGWIPGAHIKYPTTNAGLAAAERSIAEGMRVNMTLCFTLAQAAAVYAATKGAQKGDVFVSPFVGRLDDRGENGMQLIENILRLYSKGDGHAEVLTASVRNLQHFLYAEQLGSHIITTPSAVLQEWAGKGFPVPGADFRYDAGALRPIPEVALDLTQSWQSFDITHPLTTQGVERFAADWNALIK